MTQETITNDPDKAKVFYFLMKEFQQMVDLRSFKDIQLFFSTYLSGAFKKVVDNEHRTLYKNTEQAWDFHTWGDNAHGGVYYLNIYDIPSKKGYTIYNAYTKDGTLRDNNPFDHQGTTCFDLPPDQLNLP